MTFYDELGLRPDASPDEVRRAYRNLARLLHPDQQEEEALRRLAEAQMRRLNLLHATLSDPARRLEYDAATSLTVAPRARRPKLPGREAACFAGGLVVASLCWWLSLPPVPAPGAVGPASAQASNPPRVEARQRTVARSSSGRAGLVREREEPTESREESSPSADTSAPSSLELEAQALASVPVVPTIREPSLLSPLPTPLPAIPRFGGTWIYVPRKAGDSGESLYPAEYIETVILEDSAQIRGRYRARYRVPDRPISSEVSFRFEGTVEGDAVALTWAGAGGSEGEGKLVLLSAHTMRVDWIATSMGTQLGLATGTAVLTRRLEP